MIPGQPEIPGAPITLALDAEGGDNAPAAVIAGALEAASPDLRVL